MFPPKPKKIKPIYLDHAAATPVDERVLRAMKPYFSHIPANPSSLHRLGVETRQAVEQARKTVAEILFTQPDTIVFTSGATEANNLAIFGTAHQHDNISARQHSRTKSKHIITTRIEHDSMLRPIQQLEEEGFVVTYLGVDKQGFVTPEQVRKALRPETILVSIMYANNEIGTVQPIATIGREILKWRKQKFSPSRRGGPKGELQNLGLPYFHTDAAQAAGALALSVEKLHVDFLTLNGAKMYGPKGVGVLYKRRGVKIQPQTYGGRQEFGLRAGTENVPGIVGFAKALELNQRNREIKNKKLEKLRNYFWQEIQNNIDDAVLNGQALSDDRLANNINVAFMRVDAEALMFYLDSYGIMCSTGSACSTESNEPSHVLTACGYSQERAESSIRFTLGKDTTKAHIDYVMKYLPGIVKELRNTNNYVTN